MYLNDLFCKRETKYVRDKTLLEPPKLWNALPFEIKNTDDYDDFKSELTVRCHSSNLDKLEKTDFSLFIFIVFVCICISNLYKSLLIILQYIGLLGSECTFTEVITIYKTMLCFMCEFQIYTTNDFTPLFSKSFHYNALSYIILSCLYHILFIQQRRYNFNMVIDFI